MGRGARHVNACGKGTPHLIYLPHALGEFVSEVPRTCYELYKKVVGMAAGSNGAFTNNDIKLVPEFAMAACQEGAGTSNKDSTLVLKVGVVHPHLQYGRVCAMAAIAAPTATGIYFGASDVWTTTTTKSRAGSKSPYTAYTKQCGSSGAHCANGKHHGDKVGRGTETFCISCNYAN